MKFNSKTAKGLMASILIAGAVVATGHAALSQGSPPAGAMSTPTPTEAASCPADLYGQEFEGVDIYAGLPEENYLQIPDESSSAAMGKAGTLHFNVNYPNAPDKGKGFFMICRYGDKDASGAQLTKEFKLPADVKVCEEPYDNRLVMKGLACSKPKHD